MNPALFGLYLNCTANSPEAVIGLFREVIERLEDDMKGGKCNQSGVMEGGGPEGIIQGFYNAPDKYFFDREEPDSPDLPAVPMDDDGEEMPPGVVELLTALKGLFPGAEVSVSKNNLKQWNLPTR